MDRESLLLARAAREVFQTPKKERKLVKEAEAPASADEEAVKEKLLPRRYRESQQKWGRTQEGRRRRGRRRGEPWRNGGRHCVGRKIGGMRVG